MPQRTGHRARPDARLVRGLAPVLAASALLIAPLAAAQDDNAEAPATQPADGTPDQAEQIDGLSYSLGFQLGSQLLRQGGSQLDAERVADGVVDSLSQNGPAIPPAQIAGYLVVYQRSLMQAQANALGQEIEAAKEAGDASRQAFLEERLRQVNQAMSQQAQMIQNTQAGQQFLAENREKEGVEVSDSGLQYTIEAEGEGEAPAMGDTVVVQYRGTLVDGTEFDSSYARGEPATFRLGGVIQGWNEGLQLIKPGGKIKLFVPPGLAYGPQGSGQIPPNATLVFEVELLEVNP
ncbi:MAG: FKBP-type peptidyl-prolyl cis-trans isomerase [Planctomycetota bacterium]